MSAMLLRGRAGGPGPHRRTRKGNVVVLTGCLMVALMIVVAFGVDIGYLALVRTEAQRAADAAALAAAWRMVDEGRLRGLVEQVHNAARREAVGYAAMSTVAGRHVALDLNTANDPDGDVLLGRVNNPSVRDPQLSFGSPAAFNAALVRVRLTEGHSGLVPVFFGRIAGVLGAGVAAEAMAAFDDRIEGFRVSSRTANAGLLPFAVREDDWLALLAGSGTDSWSYDPQRKTVDRGFDGLPELKLFPTSSGPGGVVPGNFGTLDLGPTVNDAEVLWRHIREGVSAEDLAYFGGQLRLDGNGKLLLTGDTGLTVSMKTPVSEVVGQARTVPLYREVQQQGDQAIFTVVGFAGVRIVHHDLSGKDKYIVIQPALVVDDTAITGPRGSNSYFMLQPVRLVK